MYDKLLFQIIDEDKIYIGYIYLNKINFKCYLKSNSTYTIETYLKLWIKLIEKQLNKETKNYEINIIGVLKEKNSDKKVIYNIIIDEYSNYIFYFGDSIKEDKKENKLEESNKKISIFDKMIKIRDIEQYDESLLIDNADSINLLKEYFIFDIFF